MCEHLRTPPSGLRQQARHTHTHTLTTRPGGPNTYCAERGTPLGQRHVGSRGLTGPDLVGPPLYLSLASQASIMEAPASWVHPLFVTGGLTGNPSWRRPYQDDYRDGVPGVKAGMQR